MPPKMRASVAVHGFLQGAPLNEESLMQQCASMKSWQDFATEACKYSSPLRALSKEIPATIRKGLDLRAARTAEEAASIRQDMLGRIQRLACSDGPSKLPRWGLLQRLADIAGHPDKTLASDARKLHGFK